MKRVVLTPRGEISFELEYKRVKNVNLRIVPGGEVRVSAPRAASEPLIDGFVKEKADFILRAVERLRAVSPKKAEREYAEGDALVLFGREYRITLRSAKTCSVKLADGAAFVFLRNTSEVEQRRRAVRKFLVGELLSVLAALTERYFPYFAARGIAFPTLKIRDMHSRWGSCNTRRGILTFALALAERPLECVEYVVMHELTHFIHPNHSPAFHAEMTHLMPDWRERRAALRRQE